MDTMNQETTEIVRCPSCSAGNRLSPERIGSAAAKCGKCRAALFPQSTAAGPGGGYKIRCPECRARNRVPGDRLDSGPKCGRCGARLPTQELFVPQPVLVTDGNFDAKVLASPLPVLVFAWAPWCPSCGSVAPIIEKFAAESKGRIRVGKVNVDANPSLAARFNIMSVPFLFVFDRGELRESFPGGLQKHELMLKMAPYI
jgi:thioredoxin 2